MGPILHPHLPYNWGRRPPCQTDNHLNSDINSLYTLCIFIQNYRNNLLILYQNLNGYKFGKTADGQPGYIAPGGADTVIPFKKDPIIKSGSNTDSGWGNFVINTGLERIDLFMARYDGSYYNGMLLYVRSTSSGWSIIMNHNLNKSALNSLFTINGGAVTIQNKSGLWSDAGTWVWYAYQFPD